MSKLFWGFFLLFFHFTLNIGHHTLELLPDWLDCLLLYLACGELAQKSPRFTKALPICLALGIWDALEQLMTLLGISAAMPMTLTALVQLVCACAQLCIVLLTANAVRDMEIRYNADLGSVFLRRAGKALAVYVLIAQAAALLRSTTWLIPGAIALVAAALTFLWALAKTGRSWRETSVFSGSKF